MDFLKKDVNIFIKSNKCYLQHNWELQIYNNIKF
jgi:hypothetical protein